MKGQRIGLGLIVIVLGLMFCSTSWAIPIYPPLTLPDILYDSGGTATFTASIGPDGDKIGLLELYGTISKITYPDGTIKTPGSGFDSGFVRIYAELDVVLGLKVQKFGGGFQEELQAHFATTAAWTGRSTTYLDSSNKVSGTWYDLVAIATNYQGTSGDTVLIAGDLIPSPEGPPLSIFNMIEGQPGAQYGGYFWPATGDHLDPYYIQDYGPPVSYIPGGTDGTFVLDNSTNLEGGSINKWFVTLDAGGNVTASTYTNNWDGNKLKGDVAPVPEPATFLLLGGSLATIVGFARKRRKKS